MATITYTNFLTNNPDLQDVLDVNGTVGTHNATTFDIINAEGGLWNGFVFELTGAGFTYSGNTPQNTGTITGVTILNASSNVVATISGPFGSTSLRDFSHSALDLNDELGALDLLLQTVNVTNGSGSNDTISTYGQFLNRSSLLGGAGDDTLMDRSGLFNLLVGGAGNDSFVLAHNGLQVEVHGSAQDGSGGGGETDTLFINAPVDPTQPTFSDITDIDSLHFVDATLQDLFVILRLDQIGLDRLTPSFFGSDFFGSNQIFVRTGLDPNLPVNLNLNDWTLNNWGRLNQSINVNLSGLHASANLLGTANRETLAGGDGNDVIDGGGGVDNLLGGNGDDTLISGQNASSRSTLDGGAGTDFALIDRTNATRSYTLDIADPTFASDLGEGTTIVHVERVEFHAGSGNDTLTGGGLDDFITGGAGQDVISGGGGNDNLDGGIGRDSLDGGDGNDLLKGGPGFDTLDGGNGTDTAVFSGVRAAYTITPLGADFQITGPDGTDLLTNIEFAKFDDVTISFVPPPSVHWAASVDVGPHPAGWLPAGIGDFNGDAISDLAWYNARSGDVDIWKLANGTWAGSADLGSHPAGYQPAGFGDFNHDGTSDVLWYNSTTRDVDLWKISNAQWAGSVDIGLHPAGWQPAGIGDFNGDRTSDIAWYNSTSGDLEIWKISNGQWAASVDVGPHPAGYQPALTGDFNGDGTSDIAWYNSTTGDVDIWKIVNGQWAGSVAVGPHPAGWQPLGAGDFNLDGTSDIAWYNPVTNAIDVWLISNGQWAGSVNVGTHPAGAVAVGIGDFDHNGVTDIAWRDTTTGHIDNWMLAYG